jgi:hypothetical protein
MKIAFNVANQVLTLGNFFIKPMLQNRKLCAYTTIDFKILFCYNDTLRVKSGKDLVLAHEVFHIFAGLRC